MPIVRKAAVAAIVAVLAATGQLIVTGPSAGAQEQNTVDDLGQPVSAVLSQDQAMGRGPDGRLQAFFVSQGNAAQPAEFTAVDVATHEVRFDTRIPSGAVSWAVAYSATERAVYFATADTGEVYRYKIGGATIELIGTPVPGDSLWALTVAPDGVVYGGSYPHGTLFSYDPATGGFHDFGQVIPGETYIRSVEATGSTVWIGSQPNMKLARMDRTTGAVTQVALPAEYQGVSGTTYDLYARGDRLFVRVTPHSSQDYLVYDLPSGTWVDKIATVNTRAVSPIDPTDGKSVYLRVGSGKIIRYDTTTLTYTETAFAPNAIPGDFAWLDTPDGPALALTYYYGRIYTYNYATRASDFQQVPIAGAAAQLTVVGSGPDGKIYAGAFFSPPGAGQYDPATGTWRLLGSTGQLEGFGSWNQNLVFGRYPEAQLYSYDTSKQFSIGTNPANPVRVGNEQDRPQAFLAVPGRTDQVAVGTAPVSGRLGGAVTLWNPATGELVVHRNVVPDQSVVSLAEAGGRIWGGTSIYGGFGIDPTTTSGTLFAFDPGTGEATYAVQPVQGANSVSGLVTDARGHLWGLAGGSIFEFDPSAQRIVFTQELFSTGADTRYGEHMLRFAGSRLFGVDKGRVFFFDTTSRRVEVLSEGRDARSLATDTAGNLYFVGDSTHVYRYKLPADDVAPEVSATVANEKASHDPRTAVTLSATDPEPGSGVRRIEYRIDDGPWSAYSEPLTFDRRGPHQVAYRALDNAFNASPVATKWIIAR